MATLRREKTTKSMRTNELDWPARLGAAVRTRRRALRLTQLELSSLAHCGPAFLHQLEHGKPTLQLDKVIDVLHVLGLQLTVESGQGRLVHR